MVLFHRQPRVVRKPGVLRVGERDRERKVVVGEAGLGSPPQAARQYRFTQYLFYWRGAAPLVSSKEV